MWCYNNTYANDELNRFNKFVSRITNGLKYFIDVHVWPFVGTMKGFFLYNTSSVSDTAKILQKGSQIPHTNISLDFSRHLLVCHC